MLEQATLYETSSDDFGLAILILRGMDEAKSAGISSWPRETEYATDQVSLAVPDTVLMEPDQVYRLAA